MVNKQTQKMRYLFFFFIVVLTLGLTQCQSQSDNSTTTQNPSATAVQPEKVKTSAVENPLVETVMPHSANPSAVDLSTAIARVAKGAIPAVAHIEVTQRQEVNNPFLPFENDPFLHCFFDVPRHMPRKFKHELKGLGSGMIMDAKGHIVTNNHVVAGANEIQIESLKPHHWVQFLVLDHLTGQTGFIRVMV